MDPRGGPGRVGGPSGRFGMSQGSLGKFRDELGELRVDPERVGRHAGKSETS